jgi:bacterial/archaeal transporter family protein
MPTWLPPALFALFNFGLWGLFTRLAVLSIDAKSALIYQTIGVIIVTLVMLAGINFKPVIEAKGITYSILTGIAYGIGCLFYFIAASKGKIINVVTLTALYPLVTILLALLLLKETVHLKQALGIGLALVAIILMSS